MSYWICCNSCFNLPGPDRKLAVTTCGHVICNVCFQKANQGECMICNAKCQVTPLSDKSSAEVKALFSDINSVATKHLTEISKVLLFQARHQKRLLAHSQQRNEKLEEVLLKMKQEMQQMSKKITEQNAYIAKLESTRQHQSAKAASTSQLNRSSHNARSHQIKSDQMQIPFNSPMSLSRFSSTTSLAENMEVDNRGLFRKPELSGSVQRLSLISPPQDGRMGTVPHRSTNQNTLVNHSARSATVSRLAELQMTPNLPYRRNTGWETPVFKPPSAYRHSSMSSLVMSSLGVTCPPP
ncbi:probable E3 SUMO-protein ligase RNF212 isoform X1 [Salvelinus sp. IW2-2015]|uniref:probable E3 SUMO-protein ligase RNF212 isoform X1 n=1 Tax=Salvelinus sp. IW2-2015 TaxID=2691554 RepID=UPI000CDFE39A|nr:probable E3 SUMO-protein ligase RNF212 isoform X1 [Salvelinus alpinus]XP_023848027.1 probable E3 SUMO-protein ligase RNF212 isoform X1 [Salvelinus alpinus]XP_023848028.1 probable E3 SUMO-protein ligase RNF212 isoform X1 [Salvelinus alpinus]